VILPSLNPGRAPFWRFLLCVALILALQFVLLALWIALPESAFRDGVVLARLYFAGFQYLPISLFVLLVGWLFWIGRSGWRFGILNAVVFTGHATLIIVSLRLYGFASVYVFLAVMLAFNLFIARWLWNAIARP
jgi:hypothetical protein